MTLRRSEQIFGNLDTRKFDGDTQRQHDWRIELEAEGGRGQRLNFALRGDARLVDADDAAELQWRERGARKSAQSVVERGANSRLMNSGLAMITPMRSRFAAMNARASSARRNSSVFSGSDDAAARPPTIDVAASASFFSVSAGVSGRKTTIV